MKTFESLESAVAVCAMYFAITGEALNLEKRGKLWHVW